VYKSYNPKDHLINTEFNKVLCTINELQERLGTSGGTGGAGPSGSGIGPVVCTAISVEAGAREQETLTAPGTLAGNEAVFLTVLDTTFPSRLVAENVQSLSGTTITAWVFNHDAGATRIGTLCGHILVP